MRYIRFLLGILFLCVNTVHAQYIVRGIVSDSLTHEPLPYASIYIPELKEGCMSDIDGYFMLDLPVSEFAIQITSMGYKAHLKNVCVQDSLFLAVNLYPEIILLNEVVVHTDNEHYSRKNNPAVRFVREMIRHRDDYDPDRLDFWSRKRYERMTFLINDFDSLKQKKWLYKKFDFLRNYVDTMETSHKPALAVSDRELLASDYFLKSGNERRQVVQARRQAGFDEMFSQQGMEQVIRVTMTDVDIFQDNISLFTNKFVSPLSKMGPAFYKYYLMDTLVVHGDSCVDLAFVPFNSESFGFAGHLFVSMDSTRFVHQVRMSFPKKINLNFVDNMVLEQNFQRGPAGVRQLTDEKITVDFKLAEKNDGLHAYRKVNYSSYNYDPSPEDMAIFNRPEQLIEELYADSRTNVYWDEMRPIEEKKKKNSIDSMMIQLRNVPAFYWTEKVLKVLFTGYIPIPEEKPLFYYGIMNTTISGNALEGVRLRAGGMTTANLHPRLFLKGYVAYGFRDKQVKGLAELEYSFNEKKEYANEFPIHALRLSYKSDIDQYGQHYLYTSQDNVFLSLKRKKDDRIGYLRKGELSYIHEYHSGFSYRLTTRLRQDISSYLVPFVRFDDQALVDRINNTELEVDLRYAPNEQFFQTQWNRYPVSLETPVFSLSHTMAVKHFLGGDYSYHHTELGFQKRFWFSAFGYTDVILKAGKVWNKVPFPLLIIPNANLSYTIQPESYSLMNAMEFINDQYASWDVTYYLNGWLFNRIPGLKRLQWRELVSCRGLFGYLSQKNNPFYSTGLYTLPIGSNLMNSKVPYVEIGAGIENIFKILRIDYVWRLTYRDLPDIDRHGLRISLHMTF